MLIRRPPGEVFAAFVNPQILRKFWLRDASGPLAPGARVQWHFMVPGASARRGGHRPSRRRAVSASTGRTACTCELTFEPFDDDATRAHRRRSAASGAATSLTQATDVVEGFSIVFCDLKTLLETGTSANLVRDKAELIEARPDVESER